MVADGSVAAAVRACVAAAAHEFDPPAQKQYLRAAAYGMSAAFVPLAAGPAASASAAQHDALLAELAAGGGGALAGTALASSPEGSAPGGVGPSEFVACCQKLRVLNQVRGAGLPLTSAQFDRLTPQVSLATGL